MIVRLMAVLLIGVFFSDSIAKVKRKGVSFLKKSLSLARQLVDSAAVAGSYLRCSSTHDLRVCSTAKLNSGEKKPKQISSGSPPV